MGRKLTAWKTKGMNQDLSVSAFNPEFAFENMNLRLSTNEGNTLMSWVTEKGTERIKSEEDSELTLQGVAIGTAVINHTLIVFTTSNTSERTTSSSYTGDYIYKLNYSGLPKEKMTVTIVYYGNLNFSTLYPIETLVSYEAEHIQKVYWVDGRNQPRYVNVYYTYGSCLSRIFDFVPELELKEKVHVRKIPGGGGTFAPGVIQYAFTYFDKYGHESNIFYTTPLYYISHLERGASPEDKVDNAFKISISNLDPNFQYLRIYSIQRTSINGTPFCKRIQDIAIVPASSWSNSTTDDNGHLIVNPLYPVGYKPLSDDTTTSTSSGSSNSAGITYIDNGRSGDTIDPTELLYKGGRSIIASTLEQKDNTLFLGNIQISIPRIGLTSLSVIGDVSHSTRNIRPQKVSVGSYTYYNQLTSSAGDSTDSVPCGGFKRGEKYRCGVQFQYKTGEWSEPVYLKDVIVNESPKDHDTYVELPIFTINFNLGNIADLGYKKARPVVVFPEPEERHIKCQGVINPTVYNENNRLQSSWFFRPAMRSGNYIKDGTAISPTDDSKLIYTYKSLDYNPTNTNHHIRRVEIQGQFTDDHKFKVSKDYNTLHSPDIEFDPAISVMDFSATSGKRVGSAIFSETLSDISIQTESPTISDRGGGFEHHSFVKSDGPWGIVAGLFYDDYVVVDTNDGFIAHPDQMAAGKFMVYPWQMTGSLNNDVKRPADNGTPSAVLKKKIISNLRYATTQLETSDSFTTSNNPQLFSSDEVSILKFGNYIYQGNVDIALVPDAADGSYMCLDSIKKVSDGWEWQDITTPFNDDNHWAKTYSKEQNIGEDCGIYVYNGIDNWDRVNDDVGMKYVDAVLKKSSIRMKYKSTPHLIIGGTTQWPFSGLPIVEVCRNEYPFSDSSRSTLREHTWVPCGEPVDISQGSVTYSYGDTYFQRWDCLKTYAFTPEDINQIVEIGSFMLETHVNIDGRYDRNRGQQSNLNMSPSNFNKLNSVYSQIDNFFSYKITDDEDDTLIYPNNVYFSKTKNSSAETDAWTNVTMASVLELDGDKGKLHKLIKFNDQLLAFQDTGISQILYNENVQVASQQGVPIEIANSGKVQGKRYLSNTVGCSNKWAMATTPNGIYFMDSNDKSIYLFNGQLQNISTQFGFNAWFKQHIPDIGIEWDPIDFGDATVPVKMKKGAFIAVYDKKNQDVLWVNGCIALAFSEKLNAFTSFYDYGDTPFFCNLDDTGIWMKVAHYNADNPEPDSWTVVSETYLWKHQAGDYCRFFGENKPYWMTLVGNPEPQTDKIFTNLEFRACVEGEGAPSTEKDSDGNPVKFTPTLPFDSLETWNEYQHGIAKLDVKSGHDTFKHHFWNKADASLTRKFRIWRCDIPRDNTPITQEQSMGNDYTPDIDLGITRFSRRPMDRMRNPWLYLKLMKNAATGLLEEDNNTESTLPKAEIHDIVMTYFG